MRVQGLALVLAMVVLTGCGGGGGEEPAGTKAEGTQEASASPEQASPSSSTEAPPATRYEAEQIGQALLDGDYANVYGQFTEDFQKEISLSDFSETVQGFSEGLGEWEPQSVLKLNGSQYAAWKEKDGDRGLTVIMDGEGRISGLRLLDAKTFPETDKAETKLEYGLPVKEDWFVFWGGDNVLLNYHYEFESQRYAYDLIRVKDGFSYEGDPARNESYYAFGREIVAPRDGTVVQVVNDIADNEPVGTVNEDQPAGNMVVIDHGNGEFSYLAHLKKGSATVKVGDAVTKGETIGLGGNSGNSTEPHLHFQLSDGPDLFAGKALRVRWEDGLRPVQGETVRPS